MDRVNALIFKIAVLSCDTVQSGRSMPKFQMNVVRLTHIHWWWKWLVLLKRRYTSTTPHGVTRSDMVYHMVTTVKTTDLT